MSRWSWIFLLLAFVSTLSCGGATNGIGGLVYTTDWSHHLALGQITGQSQRINILDSARLPVTSLILQNTSAGVESTTLQLQDGTYVLQSLLYSQRDAGGVVTGVAEVPVTIRQGRSSVVTTTVGEAINAVGVLPEAISVQVGRGAQFFAFGLTEAGKKTFLSPDSLTWSSLGGIGTITSDGNFSASGIGDGTVRASYTNGRIGSSAVTTQPPTATRSKWTVLVFLNGSNDLQPYSFLNMNQMERVANNPNVRFVVQWKQFPAQYSGGTFNGTRRYLVSPDMTNNINSSLIQDLGTSVDMGSPQALHDFVAWGKANYPADHYCLILWDHGTGWQGPPSGAVNPFSISWDEEKQSEIQIWNLSQSLGSEHFDLIACDACDMQMLEVAYELKDNCDYFIGSEDVTPAVGYPYDVVFAPLRDNPNLSARTFSKSFVDGMAFQSLHVTGKITQSVVDSSKIEALALAVSALGVELKSSLPGSGPMIQTVRNTAHSFDASSTRYYRDLLDVCVKFESLASAPSILTATSNVKSAISDAVVWSWHNDVSPNSSGISIDFSSGSAFANQKANYQQLKLGQATQWDEFLAVSP